MGNETIWESVAALRVHYLWDDLGLPAINVAS